VAVAALSYSICGLVYWALAVMLALTKAQHRYKVILLCSSILMAVWSSSIAIEGLQVFDVAISQTAIVALEQLRSVGWIAVAAFVLFVVYRKVIGVVVAAAYLAVLLSSMSFVVWQKATGAAAVWGLSGPHSSAIASIIIAVCGLAVIENLFRNTGRETRWTLKYLCFALVGIFGFDLVMYASAALYGRSSDELFAARGVIDALMAPMILVAAARSKTWPIDVHVSRRFVVHTATILMAGVYLLGVSGIGYYLSLMDSPLGFVARVSFVVIALVGLVIALSSSAVQSRIKNFVSSNFFSYRYDYRQEWLDFIDAFSGDLSVNTISERIVRALAKLLDCTSAAIWIHMEEDGAYRQSAAWNINGLPPNINAHEPLPMLLTKFNAVIDIKRQRIDDQPIKDDDLPQWLKDHPRVWLVIPLMHSTGLRGFVIMGRPRADRDLNWEDFGLLKTAGRQAASYIAEDQAANLLAKARRFEDFNRQFAFVVHDIKNLAGQMSLILRNAERHGDNPHFQKDVLATVADSLARMHNLLNQLKERRTASSPIGRVDLVKLLSRLGQGWRLQILDLHLDFAVTTADVVADPQRLEAIFSHLVQNAAEAGGPQGRVEVRLVLDEGPGKQWVTIEVIDNGPGMDEEFIKAKLFQPMSSTKSTGLGIGAYQVLSLVRELGGELTVNSKPGDGTRMVVRLPKA
jgi:putative PEP-CTERM system histidine kinase